MYIARHGDTVLVSNHFMTRVDEILQKCKATLEQYYGKRLKGVILYGSVARGEEKTT